MLVKLPQFKLSILIATLCFCILSQPIYSTEVDSSQFLHQLEQKNAGTRLISGTFIQTKTLTLLPVPLLSNGNFTFEPNTGLQWNTLAPIENSLVLNQQGIELNGKATAQNYPRANNTGQKTVATLFLAVISGDLTQLNDYFDIKVGNADSENWQLLLTPITNQLAAHIKQITIKGASNTERLVILEANGDKTDIKLSTTQIERDSIE